MDNGRKVTCNCGGTTLVYSCSGASDVGEIADRVSRKLRNEGFVKLTCLAGVGAGLSGYVESAKGACVNITIDGCPVACGKKILENIGVTPVSYILTDMGLVKGSTPATDTTVLEMAEIIKEKESNRRNNGNAESVK